MHESAHDHNVGYKEETNALNLIHEKRKQERVKYEHRISILYQHYYEVDRLRYHHNENCRN